MKTIHLGFEIDSGKPVEIPLSHLIVTGITQRSGKTTTLEALIKRSGLKAVIFRTKPGEKSFTEGTIAAPFFRDRSDYEFVRSLIEAYSKEKLFLEKGTLMNLCKGSKDLPEIKRRVDETIAEGKLRGLKEEIYTRLQHYLGNLIPQIQYANFSSTLDLSDGVNIVNLDRFSEEAQSLIIESTATEILKTMHNVIMVIPEAWKLLPQKYNNPCKRAVESFIRQGATNHNFIWIDSQDMAGVDKIILKSISTWLLGYQAERNEVKHTLDQISQPKRLKPAEDQIMTLKVGQFYVSTADGVMKAYVQPVWMKEEQARSIAMGQMGIDQVEKPLSASLPPVPQFARPAVADGADTIAQLQKQILQVRNDFTTKMEELTSYLSKVMDSIAPLSSLHANTHLVDVDTVVAQVTAKLPNFELIEQRVFDRILAKIPKGTGGGTYQVAPLAALKKQFLQETRERLVKAIGELKDNQKKVLLFIEAAQKGVTQKDLLDRCLGISGTSGGNQKMIKLMTQELSALGFVRRDDRIATTYPNLRARIKNDLGFHEATDEELEQVYSHILNGLLP